MAEIKWIKTDENNLPKDFVSVLICVPSFAPFPLVREAYQIGNRKFYIPALGYSVFLGEVAAWAEMPEGVI